MPTPLKLLILEDNAFDAELEVGTLQAAGYDCDWRQVQTREEFEASLDRPEFEVILADYNLPNFDGLSTLGLLRERGLEIPFVLISGTLGEERAIESLKAGATDYVMKGGLERLAPVVTRALNDRLERANRRAAQQALRDALRRLQALSVRLLKVEETERRRIARELHDGVGQLLTAVKLRLAGLNPSSADYGSRRSECVAAIDEALEQVRRVSRDLRPSQLDDLGLLAALRSHLDQQASSAGFKPNFTHEGVPLRLAAEIETTCFRIAQEALTNIARHAQASEVWVTLAGTDEELRLEVRDNGRGFDVAAARRAARDRLGALAGDPVEPDAPSGSRGRGTSMIPVRVLLADDHALVRAGIRALLEGLEGVTVVAEAGNGSEVLELARKHRPDVVLLDISMPGLGGLEASALLKQELSEVSVVMLSMHANEEYVLQALRAGASGYMLKDSATAELELALQAVMQGETYLSPRISKQMVEGYVQRVGGEQPKSDNLTPRQRQVLQLIAGGHSTTEIAYRLELSVKTVETHRAQLMDRLQIRDIAGLVKYAIRSGLVTTAK